MQYICQDMAWTTDDLDALKKAIAQGALSVKYADKEVTYRSLSEMLKIKELIETELGLNTKSGRIYANFNKGLG